MAQKHNEYKEQPMTRAGTIQGPSRRYRRLRHPTFPAAEWADKNPLLQRGEFGIEKDTHKVKAGDGVTYWNDLPYINGGGGSWGSITGDISDQTDLQNELNAKQDTLVSGTNIKTINNTSLLGSGNITIDPTTEWGEISGTLSDQTDLQNELNAKQDTLVSGTNIKTINNTSLLGSGNINVTSKWGGITGTLSNQTDLNNALNGKLNYVVANELPEASASTDGKVYYLVNSVREIHPYKGYSTEYTEEAWAEAFLDTSTPTIGGVDIDINTFKDSYQMAYGERSEEWFEEAFEMNPTFHLVKEGDYSVIYWDAYSDVNPLDENIYAAFTFYDEEWEEEIDINDIESATWDVMYYPGYEYTEYGWQILKTTNVIGRWGDIQGFIGNQTDLKNALNAKADVATTYTKTEVDNALSAKVNIDGTSIMTAPLKFESGSMRGAVGSYLNGVSFWKMDSQYAITNIANLTDSQFLPVTTNSIDLGRSANTWKDLYLGGKAYVATINNGADLSVPVKSGTLATMTDVELAASSGRMLTDQGVWYAKMYSATVAPSAEDGTNYADFSQVDQDDNPIIVIYERQSGAWVLSETITPPAEYDGYVPITSKIWDIAEQSGQQGGRVLWNHTSKEFTPYPTIISFEDIEITGDSTVVMPLSPTANQIVNKDYVDNHIPTVGDGTITLTQGGTTKGTFTVNQSGNTTIDLDAVGSDGYHPGLFAHEWDDHLRNDVQWLRADTFSWQDGGVYEAAYDHLVDDTTNGNVWTVITDKGIFYRYPDGDHPGYDRPYTFKNADPNAEWASAFSDSETPSDFLCESYNGTIYHTADISEAGNRAPIKNETIAGITVAYYLANDGHKICPDSQESNVAAIYTATGVAWYYILDTVNERFKLPRTKFGFTGLRDTVGNYVPESLPDHNHKLVVYDNYNSGHQSWLMNENGNQLQTLTTTPASESNSVYQNDAPVQQRATQMYLYFYVGEFTPTALENTAGLNAELFNDKADTDLQNTPMATADYVVEWQNPDPNNDNKWYRKYKSGWVEQGGKVKLNGAISASNKRVTFLVTMADTSYFSSATQDANSPYLTYVGWQSTTGMSVGTASSSTTGTVCWIVKGIAAS